MPTLPSGRVHSVRREGIFPETTDKPSEAQRTSLKRGKSA